MDNKKARVFISYSSKDKKFAMKLTRHLRQFGVDVWIDENEIFIGETLHHSLSKGLANCDYFILVVSKNSLGSRWVKIELQTAQKLDLPILPILIDNCKVPSSLNQKRYCYADDARTYKITFFEILSRMGLNTNQMNTSIDFDNPYAIGINAEKYGVKRPNIHNDPEVWKQYPYRERIHTRDIYNVIITMFYESQFKVEDIVNSIIDLGYEKEDAEEWSLRWKNTIYCGND